MNKITADILSGLIATSVLSALMLMEGMMGAGLFGLQMPNGMMAPIATLMLHIIFGLVLGLAYAKLSSK